MRNELQEKIIKQCPNLFSYKQEPKAPLMPICFGIECGDGWYGLLEECCIRLEHEIASLPDEERSYYCVHQIKEKFGTLRFYMSTETEEMYAIINDAEHKSSITCEICGNTETAKLRGKGWLATLCNNCNKRKR